ncbi:uncharacterized protein G2W53_030251 [Senna tora]|uniref:Uncharacterized protein n=1 Tax=Senna tora TaxID=362788 RepID=A0A834T6P4_9FABA|nr:uncharacterized protein G2W53_030251 [Senna tora]
MASSTSSRLQIAALLGFLALFIAADARPCRTFFISSYSVSFTNPSSSAATLTTFTEIRSFIPVHIVGNENSYDKPSIATQIFDRALPARPLEEEEEREVEIEGRNPFGLSSYDFSSLRDRTKDILSVVVALLFGVGCGALTAATMYMVWSLFTNHCDYHDSYDDDYADDEIESPKKMGYVKISAVESAPAPVKEAV